jgi:hypothetical protein
MKSLLAFVLCLCPATAFACDMPVCRVNPDSLSLTQVITFEDVRSGAGPGYLIDDIMPLPGATFGERFAEQSVFGQGTHDEITSAAFSPLIMLPGAPGQNLSVVSFGGNTMLNGYGINGFPRRNAQGEGEGAIAVLFDEDQSALAFELRGGEAGVAYVTFLRRDGTSLGQVPVAPTGEFSVGFLRTDGSSDIAGFVLNNKDPQGMAFDTLRFGKIPELS